MIINYNDLSFFRVQAGNTVLAFNPGRRAGGKAHRFEANVILTSGHDQSVADLTQVTLPSGGLLIDGPGEYEWQGVFIEGMSSDEANTIYAVSLDGLRLVHLGTLAGSNLTDQTVEQLGAIDILLVPLGDGSKQGLTPKAASALVATLEPRLVVPYSFSPDDKLLKTFLQEEGVKNGDAQEKLTIKKKDLENKEGEIVVLAQA